MIRLNLFMIWFLHFLSLLSVICRYYRQNSSSRIIVVLVYTVSTLFVYTQKEYKHSHTDARWLQIISIMGISNKKTTQIYAKVTSTKLDHDIAVFESRIKGHLPVMGGMA